MFRHLIDKTKKIIVTLRFSLLSIFIMLFVVTISILISIFLFHLNEIATNAALLLLDKTSYSMMYDLDSQLRPAENASQFSANNIREKVLDVKNRNEIMPYMIHLLKRLPLAQSVYWADMDGNFYYAAKQPDGGFLVEFIDRTTSPPTDLYIFLDQNHNIIKQTPGPMTFDPRSRLWFNLALKERHPVWTDAYLYSQSYLGTTVATPAIEENGTPVGVFGVDVRLGTLSQYLSKQKIGKHGEVFIIDKTGKVIASQEELSTESAPSQSINLKNIHDIYKPYLENAFDVYLKEGQSLFEFESNGQIYLASFKLLPVFAENGWMLVLVDLSTDFTEKIHKIELFYIIIFLLVFLIGLALMSHLVTRVVNPIKLLVKETERIKNFELEGPRRVFSRIKEVIELSDSIYAMRRGLRSFQKYVPAGLVRQLIKTGEDAEIGGSKRKLAIFFSDIEDFTLITEKYESHKLVKQICDYFENLTHIIIEDKGTIDKYIGDSIMAFWGAPMIVHNPCHRAAQAALNCIARLKELNKEWALRKKPVFLTYMGIHFGDAIVGSLGSSERLNYTALGDSVNIASRLVNANKIYGTTILVSETVYHQIKDAFVLRFVDVVMLKGKDESLEIYELLGEAKQSILFDINAYQYKFAEAFMEYQHRKWKRAITLFNQCLKIYPKDTLAPIFIERCKRFEEDPPPANWRGIWRFSEK